MNGRDYMSLLFKDYGLDHVFYMETMFVTTILDLEKKYGIKPILAHSEHGAGAMADGYARSSHRPGVCICQSIGSANLAAGIHDAWLSNSPVVAITGKKLPHLQYRNAYQESDHTLLFQGVTKWNATAHTAEEFPHVLRQAFREVTTGRPQPAHIDAFDIEGIATEDAEIKAPYVCEKQYGTTPAYRPSADEQDVRMAAEAINNSGRPVIVIGRGAVISDKGRELAALARKADIPMVCTPDGKSFISEDDDLWIGIVGNYGMWSANRAVREADLVIYAGSMVSDQTTLNFTTPSPQTPTIQIDIDGAKLGQTYPGAIGLNGDVLRVVRQLDSEVAQATRAEWRQTVLGYKDEFLSDLKALGDKASDGINTVRMCAAVSAALPDDAIVVADTGWSAMWSSTAVRMKGTQDYFRAAGSLGWSFPGSLGVKCANMSRPVFNFIGDGGMLYYFTEWETAVRNGLNTISIVNNNGHLAQCIEIKDGATPEMIEQELANVAFPTVNFAEAAKQFGADGIRVEREEDIAPAIKAALESGRPTLIEVMTDWRIMPLAPVK